MNEILLEHLQEKLGRLAQEAAIMAKVITQIQRDLACMSQIQQNRKREQNGK